LHITPEIL
jgi:hypothetical protein